MILINGIGNVIKDVGSNKAKAEYLQTLGYKELKATPKEPKPQKTPKEPKKQ